MKRTLLSLPMLAVGLFLIADGLYSGLSNYYPESTRPFGILLTAWGTLFVLLLAFAWARPSKPLLRIIAGATFLPVGIIMVGNVWSYFQFGWEVSASSIAITLVVGAALALAYFCIVPVVRSSIAG